MRKVRNGCIVFCVVLSLSGCLAAKEDSAQKPRSWGYVRSGPLEVRSKPNARKKAFLHLGRGALLEVLKTQSKGGANWAQVRVLNLETLNFDNGWVEADRLEAMPPGRFPPNAEIFRLLGGPYLDDFTAAHSEIARWLIQEGAAGKVLLCFVNSRDQPYAKLVVFLPSGGKLAPGPSLNFPSAELEAGITSLEVRDLLGDGNECLITHEPFRGGPNTHGTNVVIRRIAGKAFQTLWKAPIEYRYLDVYPAKIRILDPPEKNIATAGTVTTGDVSFHGQGKISEPEWKGKVEFYVVGRDAPVDTVKIDKVCPWEGTKFTPLY
jgi:hypothetical protein